MSTLTIKAEGMAGESIEVTIEDAKNLCIRMGVAYVQFSFNGCSVSVGKNCNVDAAMSEWDHRGGCSAKYGYVFN